MTKSARGEKADARDLKSLGESRAGSSPAARTSVFSKAEYKLVIKPPKIWCQVCGKYIRKLSMHIHWENEVIDQLVDAVYPILIPAEEQCVQIQEENRKEVKALCTKMWRGFRRKKDDKGRKDGRKKS